MLSQTKTCQHYYQIHSVVLPRINNSVLCPVAAVTEMFARIPALPSDIAFGYWELSSPGGSQSEANACKVC